MQTVQDLRDQFPRSGRLEWIGISPERRAELESVDDAELKARTGIEGEHHATSGRSERQVTIIQHEHLAVVASLLGRDAVEPGLLRRNLAVSGISVWSLKDKQFRIGNVLLEGTGPCEPCSRMEENLGPGGYNAMRGHGGICARVLAGGHIRVGDDVVVDGNGA
jgi:MOSC domain-containing protein YiiM